MFVLSIGIVVSEDDWDHDHVEGVFTTEEAATKYLECIDTATYEHWCIQRFNVDEPWSDGDGRVVKHGHRELVGRNRR